ncbi:hypothetical protein [Facilibium subflavum]|uniref:hypothetical protein n=1 Tax=Facilibium subflavum TaxID=2219058 RepID=UPI000E653B53|nr:hypothetical protein [Facilibium subflavum]
MFIFTLSSFLDRFDPYWYGRLMALKLSYVAVILFTVNAFLKSPFSPILSMLVAGAGILVIETPVVNTMKKKDIVYLLYVILTLLTIILFNLLSYFLLGFLIGASLWALCLYMLFRKQPQVFSIISLILLLGLMSLEGQPATNIDQIINIVLYFLEFCIITFWAHKMFPCFYLNIYKSALLRLLYSYKNVIEQKSLTPGSNITLMQHFSIIKLIYPLLKYKSYAQDISSLNIACQDFKVTLVSTLIDKKPDGIQQKKRLADIDKLIETIKKGQDWQEGFIAAQDQYEEAFSELVKCWSRLCKKS